LRSPHKPHARDQPGDQIDRRSRDVRALALFKLAVQLLQIAGEGLVWAKGFRFHVRPPQAPTEADSYTRTKIEQAALQMPVLSWENARNPLKNKGSLWSELGAIRLNLRQSLELPKLNVASSILATRSNT